MMGEPCNECQWSRLHYTAHSISLILGKVLNSMIPVPNLGSGLKGDVWFCQHLPNLAQICYLNK